MFDNAVNCILKRVFFFLLRPHCAGILHLGQVRFDTVTDLSGDSGVISDQQPLVTAAKLLGVPADQLETALTKKKNLVIRGTAPYRTRYVCVVVAWR